MYYQLCHCSQASPGALGPRQLLQKSPQSESQFLESGFFACLGTDCAGNVEGQGLPAQKDMEMGASGAPLNSAVPASPVSWLFFPALCLEL